MAGGGALCVSANSRRRVSISREGAATLVDEACQRDARIRVVDPQRLVAQDAFAQLLSARVARDRVGSQRVQVDDERIGDERVKEELDAGATLERAALREPGRRANGVFVTGEFLWVMEGVEKGRNVEGDQVLLAQGRERNPAGLDEEGISDLCGRVPAPRARVFRVRADLVGQLDEVGDEVVR